MGKKKKNIDKDPYELISSDKSEYINDSVNDIIFDDEKDVDNDKIIDCDKINDCDKNSYNKKNSYDKSEAIKFVNQKYIKSTKIYRTIKNSIDAISAENNHHELWNINNIAFEMV